MIKRNFHFEMSAAKIHNKNLLYHKINHNLLNMIRMAGFLVLQGQHGNFDNGIN